MKNKSSNQTPSVATLNFAKSHGYKYVGNGWFLPVEPVLTIGEFKRIHDFSIHERINLRSDMQGLCKKHSVHIMSYFKKRWFENHIYGRFLVDNKV